MKIINFKDILRIIFFFISENAYAKVFNWTYLGSKNKDFKIT